MITDDDYGKLIELNLKTRQVESMLAEGIYELKKVNETIREMLLRKGNQDGGNKHDRPRPTD